MLAVHVYKDFDPGGGGGGVARHMHGLVTCLSRMGIQCAVLAPDPEFEADAYEVRSASYGRVGAAVADADVVHVHGARTPYSAWAAFHAARLGKRVVYTPHCYYDDGTWAKRTAKKIWDHTVERMLLTRSARTILLAADWRDYLRHRNLPCPRPAIVPNCVHAADVLRLVPADRPERLRGRPSLLSVGRLDPVKRLGDAVAVLRHSSMAAAVLHVVGRGGDRDRLIHLAEEGGVADRVEFHGFVDDEGVARMAHAADVFVMPSECEGLPTVILEMLLHGLPVACSRIPGSLAILDVVGTGHLHEVGDLPGMVAAIERAASTPVDEAVRASVLKHFSWESRAADIAEIYQGEA